MISSGQDRAKPAREPEKPEEAQQQPPVPEPPVAEAEADAEAAAVALVRGRLAAAAPLTRATSSQLFLGVCLRSELRSD